MSTAELVAKIIAALDLDGDSHARHNLSGAIYDSEHGRFDKICLSTMKRVEAQIAEVENILDAALSDG